MEKLCPKAAFIDAYNGAIDLVNIYPPPEGSLEELENLNHTINTSLELSSCATCGGMEVDLSSGRLHCGLKVPAEVLEQNESILAD